MGDRKKRSELIYYAKRDSLTVRGRVGAGPRRNKDDGRGWAARRNQAVCFSSLLVQSSESVAHLGLLQGATQRHGAEGRLPVEALGKSARPVVAHGAHWAWIDGAPAHHLPKPKTEAHVS